MSYRSGEEVKRTPTLDERFRGNPYVQPWCSTSSQKTENNVELNESHGDIEILIALLHQAQSDIATLTQEKDDLTDELANVYNSDRGANDGRLSSVVRQEVHVLEEENKRLQEQIKALRKWQNDFESQLSQGYYEADYSLKELLDIHQHLEQNIQELQTYISQGIARNTKLNTHQVQNCVTEVWNCLCEQRPHWKMIVVENIQLKKHISDLEEALQMKHAEVDSETHSEGGRISNTSVQDDESSAHDKELERYAQLLFEATERVAQREKENEEIEKVNSKWKEFGDYLKNENKELESQLHQALDDIQKLENKIEELEDGIPGTDRSEMNLKERNEQLEKQLKEAMENIQQLEKTARKPLQDADSDRLDTETQQDHYELRTDSNYDLPSSIDDEERLRTGRVVEELASHLTELVLQVERERTGSSDNQSQCSCKGSSESLHKEVLLLKQLDESESCIADLQIQLDEIQQELNSQKLRNMVLETQIPPKQTVPRGTIPLKTKEDASTNTEHFVRPTALYTGARAARDHHRASFIDVQTLALETSL